MSAKSKERDSERKKMEGKPETEKEIDTEGYVFQKSSKVHRTPPNWKAKKLTTTVSPPIDNMTDLTTNAAKNVKMVDLTWDEDEERSTTKKRKIEESLEPSQYDDNLSQEKIVQQETSKKLQRLMKRMEVAVKKLQNEVQQTGNTKKEIKEITCTLTNLMSQMISQEIFGLFQDILEQPLRTTEDSKENTKEFLKKLEDSSSYVDQEVQTTVQQKTTITRGTQTNTYAQKLMMDQNVNKIKTVPVTNDQNVMMELLEEEWCEEAYEITHIAVGDPCKMKEGYDRVLFIDTNDKEKKLIQKLAEQTQGIPKALAALENSKITCITDRSTISHVDMEETTSKEDLRETHTFLTNIGEWKQREPETVKTILRTFQALGTGLKKAKAKKVLVATTTEEKTECIRKILELTFKGEEIKFELLVTSKKHKELTGKDGLWINPNKRNTKKVLEIKPNEEKGITYAGMLRTLKEGIDINNMKIQVDRVTKTRNGSIRINIREREQGAVNAFKDSAKQLLGESAIRAEIVGQKRKTVIIRNIDPVTDKEEIISTVRGALNKDLDPQVVVHTLKEAYKANMQVATISLEENAAFEILRKGKIKLGWTNWEIQDLITPPRCYKCRRFGHKAAMCDGEKIIPKEACPKCSKVDGHRAKGCKNPPHCFECDQSGHSAATMACPIYRDAVKIEKARKKNPNRDLNREAQKSEMRKEQIEKGRPTSNIRDGPSQNFTI